MVAQLKSCFVWLALYSMITLDHGNCSVYAKHFLKAVRCGKCMTLPSKAGDFKRSLQKLCKSESDSTNLPRNYEISIDEKL